MLPDGRDQISVKAWSGERSAQAGGFTSIVTVPDAGRVVLTRPVVYPAATAVADRLAVSYIRARYDIYEAELPGWGVPIPLHTRLVITAHDGERVHVSYRRGYRPSFVWSARDEAGKPLPPGTYLLRLTVKDPVGNVRTIRRPVDVSSAQLAEQVWTSTTSAAATSLGKSPVVEDPSCQSCGEVCGPVPSELVPRRPQLPAPVQLLPAGGGLLGRESAADARAGRLLPHHRDGSADHSRRERQWNTRRRRHGPRRRDGLDAVAVRQPDPVPWPPDARQPVNWGFSTANNYDLASFTVEYRYYTPVP